HGLRAAGWGLVGLLGLTALVVLATNVLLRTHLLRKLVNSKPEEFVVEYRGAASWFPGRLSFDSLTLRSRDRNIEFEAALQGVALRVSLADLVRRRFHATRLRARRLAFRLRERISPEEATPARLARYPRIAGYADPPLLPTTPSPPEPAEGPWRVVIDDLEIAGVEEIWIDSWKWNGKGSVAGAFELLPGREARVGPARLEVAAGTLQYGDSKVAERTLGEVWCAFPLYDSRANPGNEVWKIMSGGSTLRADLKSLACLSPDSGGPRLSGGAGSIRERIRLKDGVGSVHVSVTARDVTVRTGKREFRGSAEIDIDAPKVDFHQGEASLAGTKVVLSNVTVEGDPAHPWAATFSAPAARLFLADGSLDTELTGSLRDARPIVALLPPGLGKWAANLLHLENLHLTGRLAAGPSRLALTSLHVSAGNFSLDGEYRSSPGRSHGDFRAKKGKFSVHFTVPGGG
ncbi:MAG TPA: hypothetical protein VE129_14980, partial [Thermoanaerobaculia bacterium]|nr:hypothetical protein [Thermoanaerobaculia bacterium]